MAERWYEDFSVGEVVEAGPLIVTADDIRAFAARFDPQPMHLDGTNAQNTVVDGLYASGMHTVCLHMRLLVDGFLRDTKSMGSPGVEEVRYLAPVRAGDSLSLRLEVTNLRASASRPDIGFLRFTSEIRNQAATPVMRMTSTLMFARRVAKDGAEGGTRGGA
jgi:acyl dehydratase